jgi:outer membrane lipoprotein-sorting protein
MLTRLSLLLLVLITLSGFAQADEKGLSIAKEADKRDTGFVDNTADMLMILMNKQGQTSKRNMRLSTLEQKDDGDKSMVVFDRPRDVKGTALLTYTHKSGSDDQWLYLPALKRVKRIASNNQSGPFMGSEFAYEDLSSQEVEKYTWKFIKDDGKHFVVERVPTYKNSGYKRQTVWFDKEYYRVMKTEFYDRKNSKLKTLVNSGYKQYKSKFWRPAKMEMVNHQTGKSTVLEWTNYKFGNGLKASDFTQNKLKRAR